MLKIGSQINEVRTDGSLDVLRSDLDYFERAKLDAAEIPPHGLDVIRNGRLDKGRMKEIRSILKGYNFRYSVHAPNPLNLMEKRRAAAHFNVFQASLEFASAIDASALVYHAGRKIPEEAFHVTPKISYRKGELETLMALEAALLQKLADEFPQVTICVENARPYLHHSPYCYAENPDTLRRQIVAVDRANVRMTLDIGHLFMTSRFNGFNPVAAVSEARDIIGHVHIHDNFGDAVYYGDKQQTHQIPFGSGDSHMPVGWGAIPFREILRTIMDSCKGLLIMELRPRYFAYTEESRRNLKKILTALSGEKLDKPVKSKAE
jgi:sugar phosphate isomerase/epimerase